MLEGGIDTWRLPSYEIPHTPLVYMNGLERTLNMIKPDLVLCHGVYSITSYRIASLKEKNRFKLIYDTHAAHFNTNLTNTLPKKIFQFCYQKIAVPKIIKENDAIFAIGEDEKALLVEDFHIHPESVPIIRLGVDIKRFQFKDKDRITIRKKLGISLSDIVVLYAGKLTKNKDIDVLIDAFNRISNERITLLIVGDGDLGYQKMLEKMLNKPDHVRWIKMVENDTLPQYYNAADVGVWPGNSSITIMEAMACHLPVILPKWYGTQYLDKSGGVARFIRGNSQELSKILMKIINNSDLRKNMGRRNEMYARKALDWFIISNQILSLV
jgi:glycosyltransferase involved in cell wall biosynthesis